MEKARKKLIIFNVISWVALAILVIAGFWNYYVFSYGAAVLFFTGAIMVPWQEKVTIKAEGGFLGEDNEIDEKVIHELAGQSEMELEGRTRQPGPTSRPSP